VEPLLRNGESHCHVRIALDVSFSKKTMWKSKCSGEFSMPGFCIKIMVGCEVGGLVPFDQK
jgi:hypothetical protein